VVENCCFIPAINQGATAIGLTERTAGPSSLEYLLTLWKIRGIQNGDVFNVSVTPGTHRKPEITYLIAPPRLQSG
jgi:hypothetical protein